MVSLIFRLLSRLDGECASNRDGTIESVSYSGAEICRSPDTCGKRQPRKRYIWRGSAHYSREFEGVLRKCLLGNKHLRRTTMVGEGIRGGEVREAREVFVINVCKQEEGD